MTRREMLKGAAAVPLATATAVAAPAAAAGEFDAPRTLKEWDAHAAAHFRATADWPTYGVGPEVLMDYINLRMADRQYVLQVRDSRWGWGVSAGVGFYRLYARQGITPGKAQVLA